MSASRQLEVESRMVARHEAPYQLGRLLLSALNAALEQWARSSSPLENAGGGASSSRKKQIFGGDLHRLRCSSGMFGSLQRVQDSILMHDRSALHMFSSHARTIPIVGLLKPLVCGNGQIACRGPATGNRQLIP